MRYLLDTHIVLWFLKGEKLSEKIKELIQNGENYISVVSLWEVYGMKYLLDTHIVLWFLKGEKLSEKTKELIQNGENYISVVSLWEVAIKMNLNKFSFNGGFKAFRELVANNGFNVLAIKDEYMERLFDLPFIHRDPFDRLLIATAAVENMTVITADENIQKYDILCER